MNGWYVTLKITFHVYYYARTDERMINNFKTTFYVYYYVRTTDERMVNNFKTTFYVYYYVRTDERMVRKFKTNISHVLLRQDR